MRNATLLAIGVALATSVLAQDRQLQIAPVKPAPAGERRIALVIGNSAYKASPLKNPVNDARAISKALSETGFRVTVLENASQATMRRAIRTFGNDIQNAGGVGLFYYAGHGMQVKGRNYLIPVNADIEQEDEIEDQAVDANLVLSKMDTAKNSTNLMILDACRNNPFARAFRSGTQGLAQMDAPSGTLIAFATAPGSVAADGAGDNGLYTKHLLANIHRPGLPIEQLFKEVRNGVGRETKERQIPWESSSLRGDFFFIAPDASQAMSHQDVQRVVADAVRREQDKLAAQQRMMEDMIQQALAKQRIELEAALKGQRVEAAKPAPVSAPVPVAATPGIDRDGLFWESIKGSSNPEDYKAYLAQFPQGTFAALARVRAGQPQASVPSMPPKPATSTQVASIAPSMVGTGIDDNRFPKVGDRWDYVFTDTTTRRKRTAAYSITAVSKAGILETGGLSELPPSAHAYTQGPHLLLGTDVWDFSPYLLSFETLRPGQSWRSILPLKPPPSCRSNYSCKFDAKVLGRERITVPAGTFDSIRVAVEVLALNPHGRPTGKEVTYWFAEAAKRVVRVQSRTVMPGVSATYGGTDLQIDYDFELTSFKLN
jgi:uncharacterized caspase-like protein